MISILEEFDADRYEEDLKQMYQEEFFEKGLKQGREEGTTFTNHIITSLFQQFNQGKSDEEVFKSGITASMEDVLKYRKLWKDVKESGQ